VLFSRLERELNQAAATRDREKLSSLLSDDFEQRTPAPPMDPVPRQQWIDQALSGKVRTPAQILDMAVRTFSDSCVVDFLEQFDPAEKQPDRFVVDVWRGSEQGWKLAVRYASELQPAGGSTNRKPSGKR
jgi:Domain of unknown function (DUF4440)